MKSKKTILAIVIILILGVIFYYFVYNPMVKNIALLRDGIISFESEIAGLKNKNKREDIEKEIQELEESNELILKKYPATLSEESSMRLALDIEKDIDGVEINNLVFKPVQMFNIVADDNSVKDDETVTTMLGERSKAVATNFGDGTDFELEANQLQEMKKDGNIKDKDISFFQSLEFKSTMTYDSLKRVLEYINNYKIKTVVDDLSIKSSEKPAMVDVSFKLRMMGISSSTNTNKPKFDAVPKGKDRFFEKKNSEGDDFGATDEKSGIKDAMGDVFIDVHPTSSDAPAQTVGMANDSNDNAIKLDKNKVVNIDITILKEGEQYIARYFMNGITKKGLFDKGNALELDIYSSLRKGKDDKVGVILNLRNKTDDMLYINLYDEDSDNPRFSTGITEGKFKVR